MCSNTCGAELGKNNFPVIDNLIEVMNADSPHYLFGAKGPFAGSTPNVDAFGVENEYPTVQSIQGPSKVIETEFIIAGYKNP
jgi:hypothetical protein